MGNANQALAYIKAALDKMPQNPIYNYHMGMVLSRIGRIEEAREKLATAVKGDERYYGREEAERALLGLKKQ